MNNKNGWCTATEKWAFRLLVLSAFCSAFSLPLGRAFLLLSMGGLLWRMVRGGGRLVFPLSAGCWLVFAVVAVIVSAWGLNPALSFRKLYKLIWFMGIPVAATLITTRVRLLTLLKAYVYGAGVLALDILVLRTWAAWQAGQKAIVAGGRADLWWQIIDRGSMTHGQVLMVALTALAGLLTIRVQQRPSASADEPVFEKTPVTFSRFFCWGMPALLTAAMVLNFKRGSWVATGIVMVALLALTGRRWRVAALVIGVAVLALLPPVQQRMANLRSELTLAHGGRLVMWTKIAPTLIREHPFGIGYRALDERLMQETAHRLQVTVEKNRNHVHSNPLQIMVSTGWIGLAVYLVWMGVGLHRSFGCGVGLKDRADRALRLTLAMMLLGLILNGMVEYNFGDAELVLAYGLIFGMLEGQRGRCSRDPGGVWPAARFSKRFFWKKRFSSKS